MIFTLKNVLQLNVAPQACVTPDRRIQIIQLGRKLKPNGLLVCPLPVALANDGLSRTGGLFLYLEQKTPKPPLPNRIWTVKYIVK